MTELATWTQLLDTGSVPQLMDGTSTLRHSLKAAISTPQSMATTQFENEAEVLILALASSPPALTLYHLLLLS